MLNGKIPNNMGLCDRSPVMRALCRWQAAYLAWWREMGPEGFQTSEVYLRTPVSVEPGGWAHFDHVRMPDYRWGLFMSPPTADQTIIFGDNRGETAWQEPPAHLKTMLLRLLTVQGDTEPASVEMQRHLGATAPSLYALRNLFQVNVEEGRHLWAMAYLLHQHFGAEGRDEAERLLERRSGSADNPRILGTFNQRIETWLDFFMFTMFGDRDGKFQLGALANSGFDPLARTTQFMLTEEAFHLFVGQTGIDRIIRRTAELMRAGLDPREHGAIPLEVLQRYINYWFSCCLDLFGSEISTNAGEFFAAGIKGRFGEHKLNCCHRACGDVYQMTVLEDGRLVNRAVPMRRAMNEVMRDGYVNDCQRAVRKWNKTLTEHGQQPVLTLPHRRFNRQHGIYRHSSFDPNGRLVDPGTWIRQMRQWLPTEADHAYVASLMQPVHERGHMAAWIAPPTRGINRQPLDFEYVRL